LIPQLFSWSFDLFDPCITSMEELVAMVPYLFMAARIPCFFPLRERSVFEFAESVRTHMELHNIPYHNFYHAFDVFHGTFVMLMTMDAS
jgi:hypothetical protein